MITLEELLNYIHPDNEIELYTADGTFLHGYDEPETLRDDENYIYEYVLEIHAYNNILVINLDIESEEIL